MTEWKLYYCQLAYRHPEMYWSSFRRKSGKKRIGGEYPLVTNKFPWMSAHDFRFVDWNVDTDMKAKGNVYNVDSYL